MRDGRFYFRFYVTSPESPPLSRACSAPAHILASAHNSRSESLSQDLIRLLVALFLLSHLHSDLALALLDCALPMQVLLTAFNAVKPLLVSDATELLEAR